jgi:hypothetical protein
LNDLLLCAPWLTGVWHGSGNQPGNRALRTHLKIQLDDVAWLKAAEPAFEFWNNPEDAIYDEL